jgi:hypothetical protein
LAPDRSVRLRAPKRLTVHPDEAIDGRDPLAIIAVDEIACAEVYT